MTIYVNDSLLDAAGDKAIADADNVHLLATASTDYATVIAGSLGNYPASLSKGDATSDGGGRRVTQASATGIAIAIDGGGQADYTHYAVVDDTTSIVLYVGEAATVKTLNNGDIVAMPAFNLNFADAVAAVYTP